MEAVYNVEYSRLKWKLKSVGKVFILIFLNVESYSPVSSVCDKYSKH